MYPTRSSIDNQPQSALARWDGPDPVPLIPEALEPDTIRPEASMLGLMAGGSPAMQQLFSRIRYIAPHFRVATVEGEPGTGKLLAAQTLHQIGPAVSGPFAPWVAADFLANPEACWNQARGGLLWLSRVDELAPDGQRGLRDFLERAAHERIRLKASSGPLQLVAGSAQPLRPLSATGAFRSDLASHLTAIRFSIPPLRERREDIPLLAALFLRRWIRQHGKMLRGFAPGAFARLASHPWPGNVRELESVVAAAALECPGQWIRPIDISAIQSPGAASLVPPAPAADSIDDPDLDRAIFRHIARVLAGVNGNKVRAARLLGISRSTLYRLLESSHSRGL
ncbi:MAG: sigma 54-interacting transcriptional regulator [Acidobacteriaceae bacterium]